MSMRTCAELIDHINRSGSGTPVQSTYRHNTGAIKKSYLEISYELYYHELGAVSCDARQTLHRGKQDALRVRPGRTSISWSVEWSIKFVNRVVNRVLSIEFSIESAVRLEQPGGGRDLQVSLRGRSQW